MVLNSRTLRAIRRRRVAVVGREEGQGVVAPVVGETARDELPVDGVQVNRQQLDRGDAELAEMAQRRCRGEPGVGAAQRRRHLGVKLGEALDVHFVEDRFVPRGARRRIVAPGEAVAGDGGERGRGGAVAIVAGEVLVRVAEAVGEQRRVPTQRPADAARVGIEHELAGIEAQAVVRLVGAVNPVAVELAGTDAGDVAVPHAGATFGEDDAPRLPRGMRGVEETELDAAGVGGEEREVDAETIPGGAEGIRGTESYAGHREQSFTASGARRQGLFRISRARPDAATGVCKGLQRGAGRSCFQPGIAAPPGLRRLRGSRRSAASAAAIAASRRSASSGRRARRVQLE